MATFGNTNIEATLRVMGLDEHRLNKFPLTVTLLVSKISVYLDGSGAGSGSQVVKATIYDDDGTGSDPGTLKGVSDEVTVTDGQAAGWVDFTFSTQAMLAAGDWWLGALAGANTNTTNLRREGTAGAIRFFADTYSDGPADPAPASSAFAGILSIYATGAVVHAGASSLTETVASTTAGTRTTFGASSLTLTAGRATTGLSETWVSLGAGLPEMNLQAAIFDDPSNATPDWIDLSSRLRSYDWGPVGRSHEAEKAGASTFSCVLDNRDRHLDSTYTAGLYYGEFQRAWRIRLRARWDGVIYPRWAGFKTGIQLAWPAVGFDAIATLKATGPFRRLNLADFGPFSYPEQLAGERIEAVLTDIGVAVADMDIQPGQTTVAALDALPEGEVRRPLEHLQLVAESDDGFLFEDLQGRICFQDGLYRVLSARTSVATIGDEVGEVRYNGDVAASEDDSLIRNVVSITPTREPAGIDPGGTPEVATDAASVADHFDRAYERTLLMVHQGDAAAYAGHQLNRYAQPEPRVPTVNVMGATDPDQWPLILGFGQSDRVTFICRPLGVGALTQVSHIEALGENATKDREWRNPVQLAPARDPAFPYRLIDTDDIDDTAVLIY